MKKVSRNLLVFVVIGMAMVTWSCTNNPSNRGSKTGHVAGRAIDAAIVPGADILIHVDIATMKATPFVKQMASTERDFKQDENFKVRYDQFRKQTGLSEKDIRSVVISVDADSLMDGDNLNTVDVEQMRAIAAVELSKPVDLKTLMSGAKIFYENDDAISLDNIQMNGSEALAITKKANDTKMYVAVSSDPKTVFFAVNQQSLEAAQMRHRNGKFAPTPAMLQAVANPQSQASLAFIVPDGLRQAIHKQLELAQTDPKAAMLAGFIKPFQELRSMAISVQLDTDFRLDIASDLGQEKASAQVAALLDTGAYFS